MKANEMIEFELYVMDLCDRIKPTSCRQLEKLSDELHSCVENAIEDYIGDSATLEVDDYMASY